MTKIHKYQGGCAQCEDVIKFVSVYPKDNLCCECQYGYKQKPKRKLLKKTNMKINRWRL